MNQLALAIRVVLAAIFSFSAFSHFKHPHLFLDHVLAYKIVEGNLAWFTSMIVPAIEVTVAMILLSKIPQKLAATISIVLLAIFLFAQISVLARGLEIDCGCFGGIVKRQVGFSSLAFLAGLIVMAFILFLNRLSANSNHGKPTNE